MAISPLKGMEAVSARRPDPRERERRRLQVLLRARAAARFGAYAPGCGWEAALLAAWSGELVLDEAADTGAASSVPAVQHPPLRHPDERPGVVDLRV